MQIPLEICLLIKNSFCGSRSKIENRFAECISVFQNHMNRVRITQWSVILGCETHTFHCFSALLVVVLPEQLFSVEDLF